MATWITHLRIAETLIGDLPGVEPGCFAIGNIAPDSGLPDEKWENFTPPPEVTHFKPPGTQPPDYPYRSADLVFFRQYLSQGVEASADPRTASFLLGYFCHLVTDNLWLAEIGLPTRQRYPAQFEADPKFIWEVKEDWYGLDFLYLDEHPGSAIWQVFRGVPPPEIAICAGCLDFLPSEALPTHIEYVRRYYQQRDESIQKMLARPFEYLSKAEMDRFVERTSQRLRAIHQVLFVQQADPGSLTTALELPEIALQR
jgi:hypothetical protein